MSFDAGAGAAAWADVAAALDRAGREGRTVRVWLRDDDAETVTPALDRLHALCASAGMPILLAVIPAGADDGLASWVAARPGVTPCQHGFSHANHARPGERARELGGTRPVAAVLDDLARGRRRLRSLFGTRLAPILVPPWNRIDEGLVPALPGLGFSALSTFGPVAVGDGAIPRLNSDLDLIDWRNGRRGRGFEDVAARLARLVVVAGEHDPTIGLLTHHLAHDETAWAVLEAVLRCLRHHPAVRFAGAGEALFGGDSAPADGPA